MEWLNSKEKDTLVDQGSKDNNLSHAERANEINLDLIKGMLSDLPVPELDNDTAIIFEDDPTIKSFLAFPTFKGYTPTARQAALYVDEAKIRFENTSHWRNTLVEVLLPPYDNLHAGYRVRIVLE